MGDSAIKCTTPECVSSIEKYGAHYHSVHDLEHRKPPPFMPDAVAICERCGGYTDGKKWVHQCQKCGKDVNPGELTALFVPHLCRECYDGVLEGERKSGRVCPRCRQPFAACCC